MTPLFPHQSEGAKWLTTKTLALLADAPGLGKTAQVVKACDDLCLEPVLILCPAVARINWDREFKRFSAYSRNFHLCTAGVSHPPKNQSAICSYELAAWWVQNNVFYDHHYAALVLDESHYLKSVDAKRAKAVFGQGGLARRADRVWCLSGTPMPNHPGELWTLLYSFGVTPLSYDKFTRRYCRFSHGPMPRPLGAKREMLPELRAMLSKVMLRRSRMEVELPPLVVGPLAVLPGEVKMTPELRAKIELEMGQVESALKVSRGEMAVLEALAPSVSTLRRYLGLQKVAPCAEIIAEELNSHAYDKIVVFCVHKEVGLQLAQRLAPFSPVLVNGETPAAVRQAAIDLFQNDLSTRVFIGNITATGIAVTLTASAQVFFVEQDWVPGPNTQALKRCHRIGQTRSVGVRFAAVANSLDEKVEAILRSKTQDINLLFENA